MKTAFFYTALIVAAESITVFAPPVWAVWGLSFHLIILVALILHSALAGNLSLPSRHLILALALVPLVRIISLSIPLTSIPQTWWYPIIYSPLAAAAVAVIRIPGYKPADVGLKSGFIPAQLVISVIGVGLGIIEYFILRQTPSFQPLISQLSWQQFWPPALIFVFFIGFVEEFLFRGVLQKAAIDVIGNRGIVYVSFLFAMLHMGFLSWLDVVFVFAVALLFGWIVKRTGSLLGVTLAHGWTNIMLYLVAPFLF